MLSCQSIHIVLVKGNICLILCFMTARLFPSSKWSKQKQNIPTMVFYWIAPYVQGIPDHDFFKIGIHTMQG